MDIGGKLLAALASKQDVFGFYHANLRPDYFLGDELSAFAWMVEHIKNYSSIPKLETFKSAFPGVPEAPEPVGYYLSKVEDRFRHRSINRVLLEASELMKVQKTNETFDMLKTLVSELTLDKLRGQIVNFNDQGADIFKNEYNKAALGTSGILFGWEYLDKMTVGMFPGDLVTFIGRPSMGKTYNLLYCAHKAWFEQKKNVVFLSMEMAPEGLIQRLSAIHAHTPVDDIKHGAMPDAPYFSSGQLYKQLMQLKDHPSKLWIIDGNLNSTPTEIYNIVQYLKADIVFIDGAYLLRSENKRLDRYTRVAENTEEMKKTTSILGIPTVASYQFRRPAKDKSGKKKEIKDYDLDDIGYSDVVGQISSITLGLFQEESVETLKARTVTVLKGREGARGSFKIKWDFQKMDFGQFHEESEQLNFM